MRRLKNAGRGKSANDRRNYSKKEKEERLRVAGIGRGTPLMIDHATENATGIQDVRHRQCERDLARLLLEDTNGVGPVPVSIVGTTIAVGHSRRYFVFEAYCRAHFATNQ